MKVNFKSISLWLLVMLLLSGLIFASCTFKNAESPTVKKNEGPENKVKIEFTPNPAVAEKAAGITVRLPYSARKTVLIVEGAPEPLGTGFVLKKKTANEFTGSFIAPHEGIYPIKLLVVPEEGTTKTVFPSVHLTVRNDKAADVSDEELIISYLKDYLGRLPSQYVSLKIISMEKIKTKNSSTLYRITYEASKYEEGRVKENETMFFVLTKESGGLFISYAGKNPPADF